MRRIILTFMLIATLATAGAQRRINPVGARQQPAEAPDTTAVAMENDGLPSDTLLSGVRIPPMIYPAMTALSVGVDIWDPVMRVFGQHYGIGGVWASLNIHNRYFPTVEVGLGTCDDTPSGSNFTYRSPVAPYFRIGADYNFLYNNSRDYQLLAGLRYGFSAFRYTVDNVTLDNTYWEQTSRFDIPQQSASAGWLEIVAGVRVMIFKNLSLGWMFKYHRVLHQGGARTYGDPMYIPGYGKRTSGATGSFSVIYTFSLNSNSNNPPTVTK